MSYWAPLRASVSLAERKLSAYGTRSQRDRVRLGVCYPDPHKCYSATGATVGGYGGIPGLGCTRGQHCRFGGLSENRGEGHHPEPQALGWALKEADGTKGGEDDISRGRPQVRPESRSEAWGYVERQVRQSTPGPEPPIFILLVLVSKM